jgi:ABC-type lipoprotein release transport system permease subunit
MGGRLHAGFLFDVQTADPITIAASITVLALAAGVASWIPARRAAKADPLSSLRAD